VTLGVLRAVQIILAYFNIQGSGKGSPTFPIVIHVEIKKGCTEKYPLKKITRQNKKITKPLHFLKYKIS
jgi:hypothetical protein